MQKNETEHFINRGYGWLCKRCHLEQANNATETGRARFFSEGEAEEKEPALSSSTLARWRDATRQTLVCPRCGIEEGVRSQKSVEAESDLT